MPGLLTRSTEFGNAPAKSRSGIWSKRRDRITFDQLQKFWSELPIQKRQQLLRLDKQMLFEQARKNLYCSRCNGLLLEGFSQIIMHGKSLHQEAATLQHSDTMRTSHSGNDHELDEMQDPSVHPWGGLTTTKDGFLTVLDCFICSRSLKMLQNVFNSARAREHERELLYPDACGGGGRGWTSQGFANYGKGYGTRETCALHTARLSCDTLVDFWSALSEETRSSLLRMKEEDFIERLIYRFDSKRFCRDCRRNVIREFKELKELKRMRREPRCTSWFCVADSAFLYEVSEDTVQADWHQTFTDTIGMHHHFEWAIGTGEGKADILDFEDVGMNGKAQVNGLDLGGLSACYITLRAWRLDGRCTELFVKAHALKGQQCVHRRLIMRDGFVTITKGENIRRFFEHAEEAEEEEDDDGMDKDGNELDGDGSRPQKHAKSPELAREFLLDAATVIFKEQVEKAFREGTARQNAHSIFVCLASKLLEERLHVACKEIITLEKQTKLLEEEEKEKREEEKRKERKRTKDREKKLRRKERLKGKEKGQERKYMESQSLDNALPQYVNELPMSTLDESPNSPHSGDNVSEPDVSFLKRPDSLDIPEEMPSSQSFNIKDDIVQQCCSAEEESGTGDLDSSFTGEHTKSLRRKFRFESDNVLDWCDKHQAYLSNANSGQLEEIDVGDRAIASSRAISGVHRPLRERFVKSNGRTCNMKLNENYHGSDTRMQDRYDPHFCSCNQQGNYRANGHRSSTFRSGRGSKIASRTVHSAEMRRSMYRGVKHNNDYYFKDNCVISKGRHIGGTQGKEVLRTKQVWEPLDARKKCSRSNSDSNISSVATVDPSLEISYRRSESEIQQPPEVLESVDSLCSSEHSAKFSKLDSLSTSQVHEDKDSLSLCGLSGNSDCQTGFVSTSESDRYSKNGQNEEVDCHIIINGCNSLIDFSSSDNCSSCLSEVDSSTSSSSAQNVESSSISDSEDANHQLDCQNSMCSSKSNKKLLDESSDKTCTTKGGDYFTRNAANFPVSCPEANFSRHHSTKNAVESHDGRCGMALQQQHMLNMQYHGMHVPVFPPQTMSYYHQGSASWLNAPGNGYFSLPQVNHYVFSGPLRYGLAPNRSSDFSMRYTPIQPLNAPEFDPSRHKLHQTANRMNLVGSKEPHTNISSCELKQFNTVVEPIGSQQLPERSFSDRQLRSKPASAVQNFNLEHGAKSHDGSLPFSLFHYGSPMAGVATGCTTPVCHSEESRGGCASELPTYACSKEETKIEEYSLFSARNGTRFSFF